MPSPPNQGIHRKGDPNRKEEPRPSMSLWDALLAGGKDTFTSYETIAPGGLEWLWDRIGGEGTFKGGGVPTEERQHNYTMKMIRDWDEYADKHGYKRPEIPKGVLDYYERTGRIPTGGRTAKEMGQRMLYDGDIEHVKPGGYDVLTAHGTQGPHGDRRKPSLEGREALDYLLRYQRNQAPGRVPTIFAPRD